MQDKITQRDLKISYWELSVLSYLFLVNTVTSARVIREHHRRSYHDDCCCKVSYFPGNYMSMVMVDKLADSAMKEYTK